MKSMSTFKNKITYNLCVDCDQKNTIKIGVQEVECIQEKYGRTNQKDQYKLDHHDIKGEVASLDTPNTIN